MTKRRKPRKSFTPSAVLRARTKYGHHHGSASMLQAIDAVASIERNIASAEKQIEAIRTDRHAA